MKYFKNVEVAKMYGVSMNAVGHWIESALEGKLNLKLIQENERNFIANTQQNLLLMQSITDKGKKYKNKRAFKTISPKKEFYEIYTNDQIADIIKNIELYKEVPHKYAYIDGGADYWDRYSNKMIVQTSNDLVNTISLFKLNYTYIDSILNKSTSVNIIDLGPGNGFASKDFVEYIYNKGILKRYIAIDFSKDMLGIAKSNFNDWFGDKVNLEEYYKDFDIDQFQELVINDSYRLDHDGNNSHVNIVLFLGSTLDNLKFPDRSLQLIHGSLNQSDIVIVTKILDTKKSRIHFDFYSKEDNNIEMIEQERVILDYLNIYPDYYEVVQYYDINDKSRYVKIILKLDLNIEIDTLNFKKTLKLHNKDEILLLRVKHQKYIDTIKMFEKNNFDIISANISSDNQEIMVISKLKST